jgi:hypothetical protein
MVPLRIGDNQKAMGYYEGALVHFQQLNCRTVDVESLDGRAAEGMFRPPAQ